MLMRKITGAILILAAIVGLCCANWKTPTSSGTLVRAVDEVPGLIVNGLSLILVALGAIYLVLGAIFDDK
jgi:hypothetical protein